jgi:glutamate-ammonia-ligase adenylyltransferase
MGAPWKNPPLQDRLRPNQSRLWAAHQERLPDPERAATLLLHWSGEGPLPDGDTPFLHLMYLAASSEALFLSLLRHREQFALLSKQTSLQEGLGRSGMEEALARFLLAKRWPSTPSALAAFRCLQTGRILLQDVLGVLPFEVVARELSHLADVLVAKSLAMTFQPLREEMGLPLMPRGGRAVPCNLCAFALGKLGGMELNYSSDVDLIFFYQAEGTTDRGRSNGAFFSAWVQAATALLTTATPDGPCLRLDTNLRPRGRDGELTLSFDAALAYYREWADLWERQAWTKARLCAGDLEAGALFLRELAPVLFQPYAWSGIAAQNRKMREKSVAALGAAAPSDVKEGPGGIRDAEFAVQALQMAYGQEDRWVREPHTLKAMAKLRQRGVLSSGQHAALSHAYLLLRRAEHWAQVQQMRQTHRLPSGEGEWRALARFLKSPDPAALKEEVEEARRFLRHQFLQVVSEMEASGEEADRISLLMSREGMVNTLREARFPDVERGVPLLLAIYQLLAPKLELPERRQAFLRVHYSLRRELERAEDPVRALRNLHQVVLSASSEPGAVEGLLERPRLARLAFRLGSLSEPLAENLQLWPFLLDGLDYAAFRRLPEEIASAGWEALDPDAMRRLHKELLFRIEARELIMRESLEWSEEAHTRVAEGAIRGAFAQACAEVEAKEQLEAGTLRRGIAVVALGRLGFCEMQPRSDADLVCVKRGAWVLPEEPDRSALIEGRFLRAFASSLTAVTRHGALYCVDFRLRPYGDSGAPVTSLGALEEYFAGPAQLWERLAYLKGRVLAGEEAVGLEALRLAWGLTLERGAGADEACHLTDLRDRLAAGAPDLEGLVKFAPGGLLHLDLLSLLLQVRQGLKPSGGGTRGLLVRLQETGRLPSADCEALLESRAFQERLLHGSRLRWSRPPDRRALRPALASLARAWSVADSSPPGPRDLKQAWDLHRESVSRIWARLVG